MACFSMFLPWNNFMVWHHVAWDVWDLPFIRLVAWMSKAIEFQDLSWCKCLMRYWFWFWVGVFLVASLGFWHKYDLYFTHSDVFVPTIRQSIDITHCILKVPNTSWFPLGAYPFWGTIHTNLADKLNMLLQTIMLIHLIEPNCCQSQSQSCPWTNCCQLKPDMLWHWQVDGLLVMLEWILRIWLSGCQR